MPYHLSHLLEILNCQSISAARARSFCDRSSNYIASCECIKVQSTLVSLVPSAVSSPDYLLFRASDQPRGTIMAKRSVQTTLFSYLPSSNRTNEAKRSRLDENEDCDDSNSEVGA